MSSTHAADAPRASDQRGESELAAPAPLPRLSVIVPCYNEAVRIGPTLAAIHRFLGALAMPFEVIVVDDGSADGTVGLVRDQAERLAGCSLLPQAVNRGKGSAVRAGVLAARGQIIMFTDADLSIPIAIVHDFLRHLEAGADIAIASRAHRASREVVRPPRSRRLMTWVFRRVVHLLLPVGNIGDTQCGCKAYRREVALDLYQRQVVNGFSFDAEVLFLARRRGYRVVEVPFALTHSPASTVRPVRHALAMVRDLLAIRWRALRGGYDRPPARP